MRAKRIKQDFRVRKKLIVIEDVPAGVCGQCGEKIVSADVGRSLAGALKDTTRRRKARTIACAGDSICKGCRISRPIVSTRQGTSSVHLP
jgi:YgiT-type zinc finger domain-containing protein